jgi:hypothetical protein
MIDVPESALAYGLVNPPGGTHTSRTLMLSELRLLLSSCPPPARYDEYQAAVLDDNVILKDTATTRHRTLRGLRELYALDPDIILFRALRDLWDADVGAQPLIALLCACARDPLLRATAETILSTRMGEPITSQSLAEAVDTHLLGRYNPQTLAKIGRNAASSWQQSGHAARRLAKMRAHADARPTATAYALLLGYLCGERGERLFDTIWARLLDAPLHSLHDQAFLASQQGWLEYRQAGMVTEIGFGHLLRDLERPSQARGR